MTHYTMHSYTIMHYVLSVVYDLYKVILHKTA